MSKEEDTSTWANMAGIFEGVRITAATSTSKCARRRDCTSEKKIILDKGAPKSVQESYREKERETHTHRASKLWQNSWFPPIDPSSCASCAYALYTGPTPRPRPQPPLPLLPLLRLLATPIGALLFSACFSHILTWPGHAGEAEKASKQHSKHGRANGFACWVLRHKNTAFSQP